MKTDENPVSNTSNCIMIEKHAEERKNEKRKKKEKEIPYTCSESSRAYYVTEENVSKFLPLQASSSYSFKARERNT